MHESCRCLHMEPASRFVTIKSLNRKQLPLSLRVIDHKLAHGWHIDPGYPRHFCKRRLYLSRLF